MTSNNTNTTVDLLTQSLGLPLVKILTAAVLFSVTYLAGVSPLIILKCLSSKVSDSGKIKRYLSFMNCFAGGVFLATCFLHLVPESLEIMTEVSNINYPFAGLTIGGGFFLVLILEHVMGMCSKRSLSTVASFHDHNHGSNVMKHTDSHNTDTEVSFAAEKDSKIHRKNCISNPKFAYTNSEVTSETFSKIDDTETEFSNSSCNKEGSLNTIHHNMEPNKNVENSSETNLREHIETLTSKLRNLILLLALSGHMLFEGMAIGLQQNALKTWTLLGALSIHKSIVSFSLGIQMTDNNYTVKKYLLILFAIAMTSPIGAGLGIGVYETNESSRMLASGVLQSLAAGTFIYITFFEILQKELENTYSLPKVFLILFGFAFIAAALVVVGEEE